MKLIFSKNDFKYEIEGVMKLFIPATLFDIEYADAGFSFADIQGDYAFVRRADQNDRVLVYALCRLAGKTAHKWAFLQSNTRDFENECELALCKCLYKCLSRLTGKIPEWGVITGVRPVKQVNRLLSVGMTDDGIRAYMKERYLCSDKKTDIALMTAHTQKPLLDSLDERSFGLYISVPFCPTRCSYCSFVSQSVGSVRHLIPEYVRLLCEEIETTAALCEKIGIYPDSVYFGGGTPTTLSASQLSAVMDRIARCFDLSRVREYTVEAGRPDTITEEKLLAVKSGGATRVSINPQSLSDDVLKAIGRKHTVRQFLESYDLARKVGFECINTDIIAGLPADTEHSFENTVNTLIDKKAENITVHTLSIKRAARLNREGTGSALKNPAGAMVAYATDRLLASGYRPYYLYRQKNMLENQENIGWALSGKESLYNIYIMEEVQTIIALGAGGSTKLVDKKGGRLERVFNYKYPGEYITGFEEMIRRKGRIGDFYAKK